MLSQKVGGQCEKCILLHKQCSFVVILQCNVVYSKQERKQLE
jgi:hypothetical protein